MKHIKWKLRVAVIIVIVFTLKDCKYLLEFTKIKQTPVPSYLENAVNTRDSIIHFDSSFSYEGLNPLAVYTHNNEYGIAVFRRKASKSLKSFQDILIDDSDEYDVVGKVYTGSIFNDDFWYSYSEGEEYIDKIALYIEGFKDEYIVEKEDSLLYVNFPIQRTCTLKFDDERYATLLTEKNNNLTIEFNQLVILKKEDYVYIYYLKPIYNKGNFDSVDIRDLINPEYFR